MNAIVKSPVEAYVDQVLPSDRMEDIARSLPSHIKPALFQRNLLNVLMNNAGLMKHEPGYVFREVSKAAGLGLMLDPLLGEAYMIEAYDFRERKPLPQLRVGYRGLVKLARQSGLVSQIYAHEVCKNDVVRCRLGTDKELVHEPVLFGERGEVVGYYAVVMFKDGGFDFEPMSRDQTLAIRDRSDAWKAHKDGKIKSTPWATDEDEMSKKTVIRRLAKRLPQSAEMAEAFRIEDAAEGYVSAERPPQVKRVAPPPPMAKPTPPQIEAKAAPAAPRRAPAPPPSPAAPKKTVIQTFTERAAAAQTSEELGAAWNEVVEPVFDDQANDVQDELLMLNRHRAAELPGEDDGGEAREP